MIYFLVSQGHAATLKDVLNWCPDKVQLLHYDDVFRQQDLPTGTYIFTDFDRLGHRDLERAAQLYLQLKKSGAKVLNNPAKVRTRYSLLRALRAAGLNDFNVYHADDLPAEIRFPVFLRKAREHDQPSGKLLKTREEMDQHIQSAVEAGQPLENLIVVEYVGEPIRPGLYRKLALYRVGEHFMSALCVHDASWLVKQGQLGIAGTELYQDELEIAQTGRYVAALRQAFEIAHIEYGRADFGFYQGRIQIFEINTNPQIVKFAAHPFPMREESQRVIWQKLTDALGQLDNGMGKPIILGPEKFRRNWSRRLKRIFVHKPAVE